MIPILLTHLKLKLSPAVLKQFLQTSPASIDRHLKKSKAQHSILGNKLQNRNFANQVVETHIKAKLLNKMTKLGMPDSYKIIK